jgi:hypothetical protein
MKALSIKYSSCGFSTIELLIALALLSVIMTGSVLAIGSAQYWFITAETSTEALYKNKIILQDVMSVSRDNFQLVSSTEEYELNDSALPSTNSCLSGGLCYSAQTLVTDVSSCAKEVLVSVYWKLGLRYATSSMSNNMYLSNQKEIIANYGDCQVGVLKGDWQHSTPVLGGSLNLSAQGNTGIDVVGEYMYVTSIREPYLRIFKINKDAKAAPVMVGSSMGAGVRLNDIEVIRDFLTGRVYAYVMQHSTTSQLAVFDVTEASDPQLLTELPLYGVASAGSFPQGWRVVAYGGQLFVVSRETTGPELHIFSIKNPRAPVEITSHAINLNRTVNDMVVRDEVVGTEMRRFLYLAASSDLKEVGVYDVTEATPVEVSATNLIGSADAVSLYLTGNRVYVGRKSSAASELYVFDASKLIRNELKVVGVSEVGADVLALSGTGKVLILGTSKTGSEIQIWSKDVATWSQTLVNSGRLSFVSGPRLAPLGIDLGPNNLYLISQSQTQPETVAVMYTP